MFSSLVTVRGLGDLDFKWAYCVIPGDVGFRIKKVKKGERRFSFEPVLTFKGRPGLVPWVGEYLEA